MLKTGDQLKNGATVMAIKQKGEHWFTVLACWKDEFVVWTVDQRGDAYWGHYFQKQEDAMMLFVGR